jgi:hypothetical protein
VIAIFNNNIVYDYLGKNFFPQRLIKGCPDMYMHLGVSAVLALVLTMMYKGCRENFFFEVGPKEECNKGYRGKNVNFEYSQPGLN